MHERVESQPFLGVHRYFDDRFSVIWYLEDELPIVRAVVPTARFTRGSTGLKSRVEEIVRQASDDRVKLPWA